MRKDNFIKSIEKIKVNKDLDTRILNATIYKDRKNYGFKKKIVVGIILMSLFLGTGVLAKEYISELIFKIIKNNDNSYQNNVEINEPVYILENSKITCTDIESLKDLENSLDIKFVFDSNKYNPKINNCDIKKDENGNIESVKVSALEFYDFTKDNAEIDEEYREDFTKEEYLKWQAQRKEIDVYISFMSEYASKKTKEEFKNIEIIRSSVDLRSGESNMEMIKYYFKNLNTYGYYFIAPSKRIPLQKEVIFVHNNILYEFSGNKMVTIEELLNIIASF